MVCFFTDGFLTLLFLFGALFAVFGFYPHLLQNGYQAPVQNVKHILR